MSALLGKFLPQVVGMGDSDQSDWMSTPTISVDGWPEPLGESAYHGVAGDIVVALLPRTEADPAAVLLQFLCAFGNACGRNSYMRVEADRHPPQIWPVIVGETAKGRKGTAWGRTRSVFQEAAPQWARVRILSGLSSGEGLLWAVRDPIVTMAIDKKTGDRVETEADCGVDDKRLLVIESEFASPLRHMERTGNTLSATLRTLWDTGTVASLTKNSPAKTTDSMVSVIGHVTIDELRRYLTRTEMANGLANRFLFVCVRRSKELPFGGDDLDLAPYVSALKPLLSRLMGERRIGWASDAVPIWREAYHDLSAGRAGLTGAVASRVEAQVLRLALIYALLDDAANVSATHLTAALEVWRYCEQSVTFIFGSSTGDPTADEIGRMLKASPDGLTRASIFDLFGRHKSRPEISRALAHLLGSGLARSETRPTGGRPEERWFWL
jgi:hypothetical protein